MQGSTPQSQNQERTAPREGGFTARDLLMVFTAGWLGGAGVLTVFAPGLDYPMRLLGAGEAVAAAFWFWPRLRMAGFGAMLAILLLALLREFMVGERPGALIFYAAVVVYLAVEERRAGAG